MANFTAGTSFSDGVTNDVTALKLNALVADAVPTSNLSLTSTTGTIGLFSSGTGTAATPAIQPTGDTNTGIFFPAADTIAFSEGGAEAMRINSSGNVGIGSTGPQAVLDLGNASAGRGITWAGAAGADRYNSIFSSYSAAALVLSSGFHGSTSADSYISSYTGTQGLAGIRFDSFGGDAGTIRFFTDAAASRTAGGAVVPTERLRIDSSGNVIISSNKSLVSNGAGGIASNTSFGSSALASNTTGNRNTASGVNALTANTTGSQNTASAINALFSNTTGNRNTASGPSALHSNTTGSENTASGYIALFSNTTGVNNTAIGFQAGYGVGSNSNTTGANNTFIGNESVGASATADNVITLGNGSIATLRCQVTAITALSDSRDKKDIQPLSAGLEFIGKLRPVSFVWNTRDKAKVNIPDAGFIAQELLVAQEEAGVTIPNLVSQENPEKLEAAYATLIPVLVQAIKELKAKVESLEQKNK